MLALSLCAKRIGFIRGWARETANWTAYQKLLHLEMLLRPSCFCVPPRGDAVVLPLDLLFPRFFPPFEHPTVCGRERAPEVREEAVVFSFLFQLSPARV